MKEAPQNLPAAVRSAYQILLQALSHQRTAIIQWAAAINPVHKTDAQAMLQSTDQDVEAAFTDLLDAIRATPHHELELCPAKRNLAGEIREKCAVIVGKTRTEMSELNLYGVVCEAIGHLEKKIINAQPAAGDKTDPRPLGWVTACLNDDWHSARLYRHRKDFKADFPHLPPMPAFAHAKPSSLTARDAVAYLAEEFDKDFATQNGHRNYVHNLPGGKYRVLVERVKEPAVEPKGLGDTIFDGEFSALVEEIGRQIKAEDYTFMLRDTFGRLRRVVRYLREISEDLGSVVTPHADRQHLPCTACVVRRAKQRIDDLVQAQPERPAAAGEGNADGR